MKSRKNPPAIERRFVPLSGVEVRADEDNGVVKFKGHAAVFDQEAVIAGMWREKVSPGAFTKTIEESDVRFLINHDPNLLGARTKSGTLKLSEDDTGLLAEADLDPRQTYINDLKIAMERGDLDQMSYAFRVIRDEWNEEPEDGGLPTRDIKEVQLWDTSPVTFPAFDTTDAELVSARSLLDARPDVREIVEREAESEEQPEEPAAEEPEGYSLELARRRLALRKRRLT